VASLVVPIYIHTDTAWHQDILVPDMHSVIPTAQVLTRCSHSSWPSVKFEMSQVENP
jgi:hypothetical protein